MSRSRDRLVIAIDGPVGAGKSTAARRLAKALGCLYIDSGAMYRAVGWKALRAGIELHDDAALNRLVATTDVQVVQGDPGPRVLVDGIDVRVSCERPSWTRPRRWSPRARGCGSGWWHYSGAWPRQVVW